VTYPLLAIGPLLVSLATAQSGRLDRWFPVEDPPNANFHAVVAGTGAAATATLTAANAAIPNGTDIGYQALNGKRADDSTAGFAFDPGADFSVAIDYNLSYVETGAGTGLNLGIGFGIGEDGDGRNSAGIALLRRQVPVGPFTVIALGIGGAARINDVDQPQLLIGAAPNNLADDGALIISYSATSGDITVGHSETPGAAAATQTGTFSGIVKQWAGRDLMPSFFMRSEGWTGGGATAVFSNPRVIAGSARDIAPKVVAVSRSGGQLGFSFAGGAGWSYRIQGGADPAAFPDDLTGEPGTSLAESPAGSGHFAGSVDVSGRGASYFLRFGPADEP
jgi:hypothetical protein